MISYHERHKWRRNPTDVPMDVISMTIEMTTSNFEELLSQLPPAKDIIHVRPLYNLKKAIQCSIEDREHSLDTITIEAMEELAKEISHLFPYVPRHKLEERA